jgi:hypothetical protein
MGNTSATNQIAPFAKTNAWDVIKNLSYLDSMALLR